MRTELESRVAARFGVLPNFFRLTTDDPKITENLWGFAQFAYLDNPLPSLLKERLFVYLSLFCEVRYCIARHVGFLVGLGHPSGDPQCLPQSVNDVLPLLRGDLPFRSALDKHIALCEGLGMGSFPPEPDSAQERAIFVCAAHLFLRTPDASRALHALKSVFDGKTLEYTRLFLAFIRTAHYWTEIHPELVLEDDINQLLATHEAIAACVLADPAELPENKLARRISEDLISLRALKQRPIGEIGIMPRSPILTSWKEIAQYAGKAVRTVQRWERELDFPVRRTKTGRKSSVLAVPGEIDAWVQSQRLGEQPGSERTTGIPCKHAKTRSIVLFSHPNESGEPLRVILSVSCDRCGGKFCFADGLGALCFNDERTEMSAWLVEAS